MSVLAQKNILIGISGGIAAYKIPLLIRQLTKLNAKIKVVMTPSSKEFVTPLTLSTLSKNDVFSEFTTQKNNNFQNLLLKKIITLHGIIMLNLLSGLIFL